MSYEKTQNEAERIIILEGLEAKNMPVASHFSRGMICQRTLKEVHFTLNGVVVARYIHTETRGDVSRERETLYIDTLGSAMPLLKEYCSTEVWNKFKALC